MSARLTTLVFFNIPENRVTKSVSFDGELRDDSSKSYQYHISNESKSIVTNKEHSNIASGGVSGDATPI